MNQTGTNNNRKFSIRARARSFRYAFEGVAAFFRKEPNAQLHGLGTIAVIVLSALFQVSGQEMIAFIFSLGFVWCAELFNTAIEKLTDIVSPGKTPAAKFIKDVSAAAVLMAAVTALTVGCIVFIPKIAAIW